MNKKKLIIVEIIYNNEHQYVLGVTDVTDEIHRGNIKALVVYTRQYIDEMGNVYYGRNTSNEYRIITEYSKGIMTMDITHSSKEQSVLHLLNADEIIDYYNNYNDLKIPDNQYDYHIIDFLEAIERFYASQVAPKRKPILTQDVIELLKEFTDKY